MKCVFQFLLPILLVVIGTSVLAQTETDSKERLEYSLKIDSISHIVQSQKSTIDSLNNIVGAEYNLVKREWATWKEQYNDTKSTFFWVMALLMNILIVAFGFGGWRISASAKNEAKEAADDFFSQRETYYDKLISDKTQSFIEKFNETTERMNSVQEEINLRRDEMFKNFREKFGTDPNADE